MIDLKYSLVVDATADPNFFGFHSPELEGFTGVGHSIEDCLYKAKWGMEEHVALLRAHNFLVPEPNPNPTVMIQKMSGASSESPETVQDWEKRGCRIDEFGASICITRR